MRVPKYLPRNDRVLVRIIEAGTTRGGLHIPSISAESKEYVVEAVGPKVENLKPGDFVLLGGQRNVNWALLPGESDLLIIDEANVLLVKEWHEVEMPAAVPLPENY